jgi:hypothetical protein
MPVVLFGINFRYTINKKVLQVCMNKDTLQKFQELFNSIEQTIKDYPTIGSKQSKVNKPEKNNSSNNQFFSSIDDFLKSSIATINYSQYSQLLELVRSCNDDYSIGYLQCGNYCKGRLQVAKKIKQFSII